jgi:hypothetical protein
MSAVRFWAGLMTALLIVAGCARSKTTIDLLPPFSDDTVVGQLAITWSVGSAPAEGRDCEVTFRVDASNRLADRLYLRLRDARVVGQDVHAATPAGIQCALAPGATTGVLVGGASMPCAEANRVRDLQVDHLVIPLSQRGQSFYREFLLRQRPADGAAIDAEIAVYAAAPACRPAP